MNRDHLRGAMAAKGDTSATIIQNRQRRFLDS
jgi:hypothetical protein